jgi:hypothetical protein
MACGSHGVCALGNSPSRRVYDGTINSVDLPWLPPSNTALGHYRISDANREGLDQFLLQPQFWTRGHAFQQRVECVHDLARLGVDRQRVEVLIVVVRVRTGASRDARTLFAATGPGSKCSSSRIALSHSDAAANRRSRRAASTHETVAYRASAQISAKPRGRPVSRSFSANAVAVIGQSLCLLTTARQGAPDTSSRDPSDGLWFRSFAAHQVRPPGPVRFGRTRASPAQAGVCPRSR